LYSFALAALLVIWRTIERLWKRTREVAEESGEQKWSERDHLASSLIEGQDDKALAWLK